MPPRQVHRTPDRPPNTSWSIWSRMATAPGSRCWPASTSTPPPYLWPDPPSPSPSPSAEPDAPRPTTMSILNVLESGLPVLLLHFLVTLALLALGAFIYVRITPYRELTLIREGNMAAGTLFAGTLVALAIPLAATLATSPVALDILVWGLVAL